jgi:hypothetical protein
MTGMPTVGHSTAVVDEGVNDMNLRKKRSA